MNWKHLGGHILFWIIIMLTYAISEWGYRDNFAEAMLFELLYLPIRLIAVYVNWWILVPKWLYKNDILKYLLSITTLLFLLAVIQRCFVVWWGYPTFFPDWTSYSQMQDPFIFFRIVQNVVIIAAPVAFSTGIKIFMDWYAEKNRSRQLAIEKREAELKYLKSQINPHFLFNTLNNLYGLSIEQSKKVPQLLVKLSDFLHYSLYESAAEQIVIGKEMKLIEDFVALESERYENRFIVHWDIDDMLFYQKIAPLLFIPLVENAFKHGVREELGQATIEINLAKEEEGLLFLVKNSLPSEEAENVTSGIGLKNLKRRLELLYPNKYELTLEKENGEFCSVLRLRI